MQAKGYYMCGINADGKARVNAYYFDTPIEKSEALDEVNIANREASSNVKYWIPESMFID